MATRPALPENLMDLTAPALPEADLSALAALATADPETFQKSLGMALQKLVIQGFRTLQAPRNWKEQATAIDLLRKVQGWDSKDKGAAVPVGMVGVLRAVNRRPIVEVLETVDDGEPGFE